MLPHLIEFAHAMAFVIASEAKQSHVGHASHPLPEIASSSAHRALLAMTGLSSASHRRLRRGRNRRWFDHAHHEWTLMHADGLLNLRSFAFICG